MTITTRNQDLLASWLCNRIGYLPTQGIRCIGNLQDNQITGVVGFDCYNGASVMMHVAGEGQWCSRSLLYAAFDYPFNRMRCSIVIGLVPSGNEAALRFNRHIGFKDVYTLRGAHPDGALFVMTLAKADCRYVNARFGREVKVKV